MDARENEFNVDDYRRPHDSTTEWKLRRAFILSNKDQLEKDELITLASCYVNVHFYGCRYDYAHNILRNYFDEPMKSIFLKLP